MGTFKIQIYKVFIIPLIKKQYYKTILFTLQGKGDVWNLLKNVFISWCLFTYSVQSCIFLKDYIYFYVNTFICVKMPYLYMEQNKL